MNNKYIRIPFYYRGILFNEKTVDEPYSYAINKLNTLYNVSLLSKENVKNFVFSNNSAFVRFLSPTETNNIYLLCEISSNGAKFGFYDKIQNQIIDANISILTELSKPTINKLCRTASGACYYYTKSCANIGKPLKDEIEDMFIKHLQNADKHNENFMKTADLRMIYKSTGVLTAPELHDIMAVVKAGTPIQLKSLNITKKLMENNAITENPFVQTVIPLGKSVEIALNVKSEFPVFLHLDCENNRLDILDISGNKTIISKEYLNDVRRIVDDMNISLGLSNKQLIFTKE